MQVVWPLRYEWRDCGVGRAADHRFRLLQGASVTQRARRTSCFLSSAIATAVSVPSVRRVRRAVCCRGFSVHHQRARRHTTRRAGLALQSDEAAVTAIAELLFTQAWKIDQSGGSIPSWMAILLDSFAEVRIDDNTENEVWVLKGIPCVESYQVVRKNTSLLEIAVGGLAAGSVVEFIAAFLCHPFDTVTTRLQADPKRALRKYPTFKGLYDGFGPVALTVPLLAVFWATRDAVRKSIVVVVREGGFGLPSLPLYATTIASIAGESVYWLIKAPSQVLKTQQQVQRVEGADIPAVNEMPGDLIRKGIEAWPVLALVDVPYVGLRVGFFLALQDSGMVPPGAGEDALLYTVANVIAVMLTTPLDVVRTQMLLRGKPLQELPVVVQEIYDESGIFGFVAGWSPRLLYNGIIVGIIWGFVRQGYADVRARFFLEVLDKMEKVLLLPLQQVLPPYTS